MTHCHTFEETKLRLGFGDEGSFLPSVLNSLSRQLHNAFEGEFVGRVILRLEDWLCRQSLEFS